MFRFADKKEDITVIHNIYLKNQTIYDIDFGDEISPFALSEQNIIDIIKQYNIPDMYDTRVYIKENNESAFAYEQTPISFEILFIATDNTNTKIETLVTEIIKFLKKKADASAKRKQINFYVNDRDGRGIAALIKPFKAEAFEITLSRNYFPFNTDGWKCYWESETTVRENDKGNTGGALAVI